MADAEQYALFAAVAGGGNSFPKPLSAEEERHYLR